MWEIDKRIHGARHLDVKVFRAVYWPKSKAPSPLFLWHSDMLFDGGQLERGWSGIIRQYWGETEHSRSYFELKQEGRITLRKRMWHLGWLLLGEHFCKVRTQQVALDEVEYDRSAGTEVCTQQVSTRAYISIGTAVCTLQMVRIGVGCEESE